LQGFFRKAAQIISRGVEGLQPLLNAIFNPTFHIFEIPQRADDPRGSVGSLCRAVAPGRPAPPRARARVRKRKRSIESTDTIWRGC